MFFFDQALHDSLEDEYDPIDDPWPWAEVESGEQNENSEPDTQNECGEQHEDPEPDVQEGGEQYENSEPDVQEGGEQNESPEPNVQEGGKQYEDSELDVHEGGESDQEEKGSLSEDSESEPQAQAECGEHNEDSEPDVHEEYGEQYEDPEPYLQEEGGKPYEDPEPDVQEDSKEQYEDQDQILEQQGKRHREYQMPDGPSAKKKSKVVVMATAKKNYWSNAVPKKMPKPSAKGAEDVMQKPSAKETEDVMPKPSAKETVDVMLAQPRTTPVLQPRKPPMPPPSATFYSGARSTRELARERAKHGDTRMLEYQKAYEEKKKRKQAERRAWVSEHGWSVCIPDNLWPLQPDGKTRRPWFPPISWLSQDQKQKEPHDAYVGHMFSAGIKW